jgi:hypothetical protein
MIFARNTLSLWKSGAGGAVMRIPALGLIRSGDEPMLQKWLRLEFDQRASALLLAIWFNVLPKVGNLVMRDQTLPAGAFKGGGVI